MKHKKLALSTRDTSRDSSGDLITLADADYRQLLEGGPLMQLGNVVIAEDAIHYVLPDLLWKAVDLHQCGLWGSCYGKDTVANQVAVSLRQGRVVSRWFDEAACEFSVTTDFDLGQTTVALSPSQYCCEVPLSTVPLGTVWVDGEVWSSTPNRQLWFAIGSHFNGSCGNRLFPRQLCHPQSLGVSYWGSPLDGEEILRPFWVHTDNSQPVTTCVYPEAKPEEL